MIIIIIIEKSDVTSLIEFFNYERDLNENYINFNFAETCLGTFLSIALFIIQVYNKYEEKTFWTVICRCFRKYFPTSIRIAPSVEYKQNKNKSHHYAGITDKIGN